MYLVLSNGLYILPNLFNDTFAKNQTKNVLQQSFNLFQQEVRGIDS